MGGAIPTWITVMLAVLAVVGTVGGAWGAQLISGRNERNRWERERAREREAHWRDKRLEVYAAVLSAADADADRVGRAANLITSWYADGEDVPPGLAELGSELRTFGLIGSNEAVDLTWRVRRQLNSLISSAMHPARGYPRNSEPLEDLRGEFEDLEVSVREMSHVFRDDLGVAAEATLVGRVNRLRRPGAGTPTRPDDVEP